MQSLYSWYQSEDKNVIKTEQEMFRSAERSYDLYLSLLQILPELAHTEQQYYLDLPPRHTARENQVHSNLSSNIFISWLNTDPAFQDEIKKRKISWQHDNELVKKVFFQVRNSAFYKLYVAKEIHTEQEDIEFCTWLFKDLIIGSDLLQNALEEKNIWWAEALELINSMVLKTIRVSHPGKKGIFSLMPLYRDAEDDKDFMKRLFNETIRHDREFERLISDKTRNWDVDRIALIDIILLKMALCEILNFPNIPVKVSINEYIDISKDYSTPKSKVFINGVIDNLVLDLKNTGEIKKTGRGLIE